MLYIRDIHATKAKQGKPVISFEFFPPKTDEGERNLLCKTIPALLESKPDYCSVTYGAGGGTREKTLSFVHRLQQEHNLTTMCHLTCVGSTADQLRGVLEQARQLGVKNILALRGDPPAGSEFPKIEGGFERAAQLVRFIKDVGGFCIGAAGFPEGHPSCKQGRETDWDYLKEKIDSGVDFVLTQLFFDNADYFRMRDHLAKKGVHIPICPGIIPIVSASQIQKFTSLCGAKIPAALRANLEQFKEIDDCSEFGIEYATRQCAELLAGGAPGLHFYTLNKAAATTQVLRNLKV